MKKLAVFDPAMCCPTGVCGPSVDPVLPQFAADLEWLKSKGFEGERYNLAQQTAAFTTNLIVKTALNNKGTKCLPLILEANALQEDLGRAGISPYAWIINQSVLCTGTRDPVLAKRCELEEGYIEEVKQLSGNVYLMPWQEDPERLMESFSVQSVEEALTN